MTKTKSYRCLSGKYKGMLFEWSDIEHEYVIKALPWMITPMVSKGEMQQRIKLGQFELANNEDV